jgi:hypothetical protein
VNILHESLGSGVHEREIGGNPISMKGDFVEMLTENAFPKFIAEFRNAVSTDLLSILTW